MGIERCLQLLRVRGKIRLRNRSSEAFAETASTTSSSSEKRICDGFSKDISATISIPELICRWKKMRRSHKRFSRRLREELSRFPKLVDSIIVTNVALRNRLPQNSTSMFQWIAHLSYLIGTLFRSRESLEQERDESPDSSIADGRKSSDQGRTKTTINLELQRRSFSRVLANDREQICPNPIFGYYGLRPVRCRHGLQCSRSNPLFSSAFD